MNKLKYSIGFSFVILLLFCWTAWEARSFHQLAGYFPLYISIGGAILSAINILLNIRRLYKNQEKEEMMTFEEFKLVVRYFLWIIGTLCLIYLLGFLVAITVFLVAFLIIETKYTLLKTIFAVAITIILLITFGNIMNLRWPEGLFFLKKEGCLIYKERERIGTQMNGTMIPPCIIIIKFYTCTIIVYSLMTWRFINI